jgi:hypothetical protein
MPDPVAITSETPIIAEIIPEEFRSAEFFKPIKTVGDLVKSYANVQPLIGKKELAPPKDDAPPEQWDTYYEKLGRPKAPGDYGLALDEKAPEHDKKMLSGMTQAFHKAGLTTKQAKAIVDNYVPMIKSLKDEMDTANQADFDKRISTVFGVEKDAQLANAKKLLQAFTPESIRGDVEALDNKSLSVLAAVVNSMAKKYMKESDLGSGGSGAGSADTKESLDKEYRDLAKAPGFEDFTHPDHKMLMSKRDALRERTKKVLEKNS